MLFDCLSIEVLSIYLLLILTVGDIFLFIYFLHYVTQSVKFETVINRIHKQTIRSLDRKREVMKRITQEPEAENEYIIPMSSSDYFQDFDKKGLLNYAIQNNGLVKFLHPTGTYLLKGIGVKMVKDFIHGWFLMYGDKQNNKSTCIIVTNFSWSSYNYQLSHQYIVDCTNSTMKKYY